MIKARLILLRDDTGSSAHRFVLTKDSVDVQAASETEFKILNLCKMEVFYS